MRLTNNHGEIVACGDNCKYNYEHIESIQVVNKINDRMKMYEKGYNAALVDIAELVAIIKQRYLDVLKDPDVCSVPELERLL